MDTSKVTRVEVIGDGGRLLTRYARATMELQDDGQTLKVFTTALTPEEAAAVRESQVAGLGAWLEAAPAAATAERPQAHPFSVNPG